MKTPTKAELDRVLDAAKRFIRTNTAEVARTHCAGQRAWMEANWHPAVARQATQLLREAYLARHRK